MPRVGPGTRRASEMRSSLIRGSKVSVVSRGAEMREPGETRSMDSDSEHSDRESEETRAGDHDSRACCSSQRAATCSKALEESGSGELRRLTVYVDEQRLQLTGHVSSFYLKQLAQETIRPLARGLEIENRLQVSMPGD